MSTTLAPVSDRDRLPTKLRKITGHNPTQNYVGTASSFGSVANYLYHGKPWFTYFDVPMMMRDSWILFLADLYCSPFSQVTFKVAASSPEVEGYVRRALNRFKRGSAPALLRSYFFWGFAPGGIEWVQRGGGKGRVGGFHIDQVRRIFPQDARPLLFTGTRKLAGFRTPSTGNVYAPYAFWWAGHQEAGPLYDNPPVSGAYDDWKEYISRGGAKHLLNLFMRKLSIRPSTVYFPSGSTLVSQDDNDENPQKVNNLTLSLAMLEEVEAGANIAIEDRRDDHGNRTWEFSEGGATADAPGIREYPQLLKKNMAAGVGIPMEVVEAAESGSGWSGRKVPYKAWLGKADNTAGSLYGMFDRQGIRPGVREAFGPKADYEFIVESLVEKVDKEGQAEQGGAAAGGAGGGSNRGGGGQSQSTGGNPAQPPSGVESVNMSGLFARASKFVGRQEGRGRLARQLAFAAMLQLQEEANAEGQPEKYQDAYEELADLAADPKELLETIKAKGIEMGWVAATSRTGKLKAVDSADPRKRLYGKAAERALNAGERRAKVTASAERASLLASKALIHDASVDDLAELADHLTALPKDHLRMIRAKLNATFAGKRRRLEQVGALVAHIKEAMADPSRPHDDIREQRSKEEGEERKKLSEPKKTTRDDGTPIDPQPHDVHTVPTDSIHVDAARMQYKVTGIGTEGVGKELKSVDKWNDALGGTLLAWRDPETGKDIVVNGHHRRELAGRVGQKTQNVRYLKAANAVEARSIGALANIAEGRGTAIDAAKYLRDSGQGIDHLKAAGISLSGKVAADAVDLKDLNDGAFKKLANGDLDEGTAVLVARHLKDEKLQNALFKKIDDNEWKPGEVATAAKKLAAAGKVTTSENTLFGELESEHSTFDQEVELETMVRKKLGTVANDFRAVGNAGRAERVAEAGNTLAVEENQRRRSAADERLERFNRESNFVGPVSAAIKSAAALLAVARTKQEKDHARETAEKLVTNALDAPAGGGSTVPPVGGGGQAGGGTSPPAPQPSAKPKPTPKPAETGVKYGKPKDVKTSFAYPEETAAVNDIAHATIPGLKAEDLSELAGASDGAEATLMKSTAWSDDNTTKTPAVRVALKHPDYTAVRKLATDGQGRPYIENVHFEVTDKGGGRGSEIFGRQVERAAAAGVQYIKTHAAGDATSAAEGHYNGYYTWPRMGYDQALDDPEISEQTETVKNAYAAARKTFPAAKSVLDIFKTKRGREWWKKNGADMPNAKFDLGAGSRSLKVLAAYQKERAKRTAAKPST